MCASKKGGKKRARNVNVLKERISIIDHFIATPIEFTCNLIFCVGVEQTLPVIFGNY
jgi:hypothetical protein